MAVTGTETVRDIITDALLDIQAVNEGEDIPASQAAQALRVMNRLMKSWQLMDGSPAFLKASQSVTATTSAAHTMSPIRPLRVLSVRLKGTDGNETSMVEMTREEYDQLPDKDATGTPTQWYYDRQKEAARLYVWPLFSAVTTETFEVTYEREFEDIASLNDVIDLPGEWYDVAVRQLSARLAPSYGVKDPNLDMKAAYALNLALAAGMEHQSVFWRA